MASVMERSFRDGGIQHIHGTGRGGYEKTMELLRQEGVPLDGGVIRVREYIDDMSRCMAAADLVISRCGAMTLSELPAAGKPFHSDPFPKCGGKSSVPQRHGAGAPRGGGLS